MKSEMVGRPSVVTHNLVQSGALHNFRTFMRISTNFTDCSLRDYHNFCAKSVPKVLTGAHKTQRMPSALIF
jgi:hypothetical protein